MLARRFSLPPVHEAAYEPRQIPNSAKDMAGTVLLRPTRQMWLDMLGEMVQMVNEAVRRRAATVRDASKPLSLEYMADRLDVDDPLRGYLAVTEAEGWMQGFITCTTFTTWNTDFRWDSTNPAIDLLHHGEPTPGKHRNPPLVDAGGSLSVELQAELHAGDPDNEGVVWPRIAELSLLGALGCGRWLVELILDELEADESPYNYVVVQATDGSIPFYERMGFVRVGAVVGVKVGDEATNGGFGAAADDDWQPEPAVGKKRKSSTPPPPPKPAGFVASPHTKHRCEGEGETVASVAAAHGVPAFELLFLNAHKHPTLEPTSELKRGTTLLVPKRPDPERVRAEAAASHAQWHVVPEDMSFKRCAELLGLEPRELLRANAARPELRGLQLSSELMAGTRLMTRVGLTVEYEEYSHWTFPDDDPSAQEPSYMMARRLARRDAGGPRPARAATLETSAPLMREARPAVVPGGKRAAFIRAIEERKKADAAARQAWADEAWHVVQHDVPFKRLAASLGLDGRFLRDLNAARLKGLQLSSLLKKDTSLQVRPTEENPGPTATPRPLVNRVVEIDGEDDFRYWYVLTYLPDLQWCHVAPLEPRGAFGTRPAPNGHVAEGRPCWMLVAEDQGGEIDVGAGRCHMMEAIEMRGTKENADTEEWDVVGRAADDWEPPSECGKIKKPPKQPASGGAASSSSASGAIGGSGFSAAGKGGGGNGVAKSPATTTSDGLASCKAALRDLAKLKQASAFLEPVDWEALGLHDYPTVVAAPMDLGTVRARLDEEGQTHYASAVDVAADVELIWANAVLYNGEGNWVHKAAVAMRAASERKLGPLVAAARAHLDAKAAAAAAAEEAAKAEAEAAEAAAAQAKAAAEAIEAAAPAATEEAAADEAMAEAPVDANPAETAGEEESMETDIAEPVLPAEQAAEASEAAAVG